METNSINKLLKTTLLHEFPNIVKDVVVTEEDLGQNMYYLHAYVVLNKYEDFEHRNRIIKFINDISRYSFGLEGNKINQISFTRDTN